MGLQNGGQLKGYVSKEKITESKKRELISYQFQSVRSDPIQVLLVVVVLVVVVQDGFGGGGGWLMVD